MLFIDLLYNLSLSFTCIIDETQLVTSSPFHICRDINEKTLACVQINLLLHSLLHFSMS